MDVIKAARELGKAIQADERYIAYTAAKKANDEDADLQNMIGEFNLKRQQIGLEMAKEPENQDQAKIEAANKELQSMYTLIMQNEHMADFTMTKHAMDHLLEEMNAIIGMCCDGDDPDTCQYVPHSCSGSCGTCGGCH